MQIKTFDELRSYLVETRADLLECLYDRQEESTEFQRGWWSGQIAATEDIIEILRRILKYGEDVE